jgi:hypothetical protein
MDSKKLMAMLLCSMVGMAQAGEKEEMLKLRNTTTNLIKELVKQGVLTAKAAEDMIKRAEADAEQQVAEQAASQAAGKDIPAEPGEVRVPYVPEFIKDELRKQVRSELRADVVKDVMQEAKTQKWGVPDALPDWISRFKMSGDLRLRSQNDFMADDNEPGYYQDPMEINNRGGVSAAGLNGFVNTNHDRHRFRERLRLALDVKVAEGLKAGVRLATSNLVDPVSTNQTLGNSGGQYQFNIDRAFLKYDAVDKEGFKWLTAQGGRIANPWYVGGGEFTGGSELVWDTDLSFEGFALTLRHSLGDKTDDHHRHDDAHVPAHTVFATAGVFPLQESAFSSNDKWLLGSQVGLDWGFENHDAVRMGLGFYDYENITANQNTNNPNTCDTNNLANTLSVPQFMQFGNTTAVICNQGTASNPGALAGLYGLASDYRIVNASASYDMAMFAPYHLILGGDYAKNIGFNADSVRRLTGTNVSEQTDSWQVRVDFGWPKVTHAGEWNVFSFYKYVEADAVLDAYTDSDFHLGGTNAKGWVIGANYGLMKNVWATGRWLSTDVINGPKYSNDILQLDLNTSF